MADVLFLVSVVLLAAGSTPPALLSTPPPSSGCADELVAFSPCLPYISDSPNNISDSPPVQCCDNFAAAFDDNTAICLCYLVHNPQILGFPINSTKLISLTSVCPVKENEGEENLSLESLCSGNFASDFTPVYQITGVQVRVQGVLALALAQVLGLHHAFHTQVIMITLHRKNHQDKAIHHHHPLMLMIILLLLLRPHHHVHQP
ncbi:non-specific lipid transfer protein GPI-anchored 25 isoform X3 [Nicotiana tabacum]|uniref:Non-specific lipid transfer protein GPI-anchored 25 isoform X3 n=1 Tax=Nicotiana tabacum TaxID=4097 RepID=A0AC58SND1_TOBAC